jgi:hypothetical protein
MNLEASSCGIILIIIVMTLELSFMLQENNLVQATLTIVTFDRHNIFIVKPTGACASI